MPTKEALKSIPSFFPKWWHHHGYKMKVTELDLEHGVLTLDGSAAHLRIWRRHRINKEWYVEWHVVHSVHTQEVKGHVLATSQTLRIAFGLSSGGKGDVELNRSFGADVLLPGLFIRKGNFLNIPCPGSGLDGDPNISIHLDDEIRNAVKKLVEIN